ncbi:deoxyribodipyrimidine photo-lyase [Asticcacaulis biprosthecium C19]|uniref:Deoxyribodipyrimidine photo-lyase n=1 Tax=Asticcacaulis biprosthecium C19 TaxID=715226 RepID=F4QQV1_9CAUL|nr:deoxyribodipyrimidine photo-lyase [Asticcacaulis biprosthecium C19]
MEDLALTPQKTSSGKNWAEGFSIFKPGEAGARGALRRFLASGLADYEDGRDRPDKDLTSYLSPHLRFGEISPRRILTELDKVVRSTPRLVAPAEKFRKELVWREFNYNILDLQPELHTRNFRDDFSTFPWQSSDKDFRAWARGETGYPLVDAGMKQLWQTGFMHNRVRMVCASFLVKHLLIDWRRGEQWFWDCLLDADPASNPGNWQWVAGCGADAAPYFRVFNPITQADKFDPDDIYRRKFDKPRGTVPYPRPIVDHAFARERALDAYRSRGDGNDDSD